MMRERAGYVGEESERYGWASKIDDGVGREM